MDYKILIATTNKGKFREITSILSNLKIDFKNLNDFPEIPVAPEHGETFELNAISKAKHYSKHTGLATVAEDSGLRIPVLDGWPGVYSSRVGQSDNERIALVLERMREFTDESREAQFVSAVAFFDPETNITKTFVGICQGVLTEEPAGDNGFGYDPIFWHPGYGKTLAQLSTDEKNLVSHRGQSIRALAKWLNEYLGKD